MLVWNVHGELGRQHSLIPELQSQLFLVIGKIKSWLWYICFLGYVIDTRFVTERITMSNGSLVIHQYTAESESANPDKTQRYLCLS